MSAAVKLHKQLVLIRVSVHDLPAVYQILEDEPTVLKSQVTTIPYSDGEHDNVLVMFSCSRDTADLCHNKLMERGIGTEESESDVNFMPLAIFKDVRKSTAQAVGNASAVHVEGNGSEKNEEEAAAAAVLDELERGKKKESVLSKFQATIKARIAVENMLETIHEGASFSFDFFMLVMIAAVISVIGLVTDSSVVLVAAMLVSPLMGPILGLTFGSVVRDFDLVWTGVRSEVIGWLMAVIIGYVGGLCAAPASMRQAPWPTVEMSSRGDWSALYIGIAVAIPSGVGVALSIMGQNTNSLVGVAISASLLPPCVNSGIFFAYATLRDYYFALDCATDAWPSYESAYSHWHECCHNELLPCPRKSEQIPYPDFCCSAVQNRTPQVAVMAVTSFLITIVNIACIWLFAALMFHLKEVAPLPNKSDFWKSLVPQARAFNVAMNKGELTSSMINNELEELNAKRKSDRDEKREMLKQLHHQAPKIGMGGLQFRQVGRNQFKGKEDMLASLQEYFDEREAEEQFEAEKARKLHAKQTMRVSKFY